LIQKIPIRNMISIYIPHILINFLYSLKLLHVYQDLRMPVLIENNYISEIRQPLTHPIVNHPSD